MAPILDNGLVHEAMGNIAEKFETIRAPGPEWAATFLTSSVEERERLAADAYVQVTRFLEGIGIKAS